MSKKYFIIVGAATLLILAGGFYVYKNNSPFFCKIFFSLPPFCKGGQGGILTPEKLLSSFEIKNSSLSPEAIALFQQRHNETKDKLQKDPNDFNSWLYLGVLKKGVGDYKGARDVFIYAGQIRPNSSPPFANLADIYGYFLNEPQKAEESIKKAIANDPKDYNFYLALADIYRYKFTDGAAKYEQTMLEALAKFPDNPDLIGPLASYYRVAGQTAKAIEWYEKLVRLSPDNAEAQKDLEELKKLKT